MPHPAAATRTPMESIKMTSNTEAFDRWVRNDFKQMNTALEELYFAQEDRNEFGVRQGAGTALQQLFAWTLARGPV